jgi:2-haloacid dehalogenase
LRPYFSKIVISDEACCSKPDPGIFDWALDGTGFSNKNEMLIIGDSLTSDIQGGINFGIDTCWMNLTGKPSEILKPTFEVQNLLKLKEFL